MKKKEILTHEAVIVMKIELLDQLLGKLHTAHCVAKRIECWRIDADAHHVRNDDYHIAGNTAFRRQTYLKLHSKWPCNALQNINCREIDKV